MNKREKETRSRDGESGSESPEVLLNDLQKKDDSERLLARLIS